MLFHYKLCDRLSDKVRLGVARRNDGEDNDRRLALAYNERLLTDCLILRMPSGFQCALQQ